MWICLSVHTNQASPYLLPSQPECFCRTGLSYLCRLATHNQSEQSCPVLVVIGAGFAPQCLVDPWIGKRDCDGTWFASGQAGYLSVTIEINSITCTIHFLTIMWRLVNLRGCRLWRKYHCSEDSSITAQGLLTLTFGWFYLTIDDSWFNSYESFVVTRPLLHIGSEPRINQWIDGKPGATGFKPGALGAVQYARPYCIG